MQNLFEGIHRGIKRGVRHVQNDLQMKGKEIHNHWIGVGDTLFPERVENRDLRNQLKNAQDDRDAVVAKNQTFAAGERKLMGELEAARQSHTHSEKQKKEADEQAAALRLRNVFLATQRSNSIRASKAAEADSKAHKEEMERLLLEREASNQKHAEAESKLKALESVASRASKSDNLRGRFVGSHRRDARELRQHLRRGTTHQFKGLFIANVDANDYAHDK
jgi:chromosome segregation ATPase